MQSTRREAGVVKYLAETTIGLPTRTHQGRFVDFRQYLKVCWNVIIVEVEDITHYKSCGL